MKVLLSPIGNNDPYGEADEARQDYTEGSTLTICRQMQPDKVVLLPTCCSAGDTGKNAAETKDCIEKFWPSIEVDTRPQPMEAVFDYEEAQRVYGMAMIALGQEHPNAELLVNVSAGTPAIKLACMVAMAEGRIIARPVYAANPTKPQKAPPVRFLRVTFLQKAALRQRVIKFIQQGQFSLAQEPLHELQQLEQLESSAAPAETELQVVHWKRLLAAMQCWDERRYTDACGRIRVLKREWTSAPPDTARLLEQQEELLNNLSAFSPALGLRAWDLYFQADRFKARGQLAATIIYLWIAMETAIFEYAGHTYGIDTRGEDYTIHKAKCELRDVQHDPAYLLLCRQRMQRGSVADNYSPLRQRRNEIAHNGSPATASDAEQTIDLASRWLTALGCAMPPDYPLSSDALRHLASVFSANCGA